jgi:hypothetical protein
MTILSADLYKDCLDHYHDVSTLDYVVKDAIPIPYFGDVAAYMRSPLRIVTAALNPSDKEFPRSGRPRFDVEAGRSGPEGLEQELSNYFVNEPYWKWFTPFQHVLRGLGASYCRPSSAGSTALHLDLCSPIATRPTWSHLSGRERQGLTDPGRILFDKMIAALEPQLVIASVGWGHIWQWKPEFSNGRHWPRIETHTKTMGGKDLRSPLIVQLEEIEGPHGRFLFSNASAANMPYGRFSDERKTRAGVSLLREIQARA